MRDKTREELISLCERGVVPVSQWRNRDSAGAQIQLGGASVLLKAGAEFRSAGDPADTDQTIWIRITYPGFAHFDWDGKEEDDLFYIPTDERLRDRAGKDWY